jgi:hypothetical protein
MRMMALGLESGWEEIKLDAELLFFLKNPLKETKKSSIPAIYRGRSGDTTLTHSHSSPSTRRVAVAHWQAAAAQ